MEIVFSLNLPREEASVPVVRHVCRDALKVLGLTADCISGIELAVTEACTNVLKHVEGFQDEYRVEVCINHELCEISVIDPGGGFDHEEHGDQAHPSAESGRGIAIMKALVDEVHFSSKGGTRNVVHLIKKLELAEDSVLGRLREVPSSN